MLLRDKMAKAIEEMKAVVHVQPCFFPGQLFILA